MSMHLVCWWRNYCPQLIKQLSLYLEAKFFAEDAVQFALEDSYISIMKNKEIVDLKAWFYRLVYLRSSDVYRKNKRHLYTDIDDNPEALHKLNSDLARGRKKLANLLEKNKKPLNGCDII